MFDRLDDTLMRYEEMMNQLSEPDVGFGFASGVTN